MVSQLPSKASIIPKPEFLNRQIDFLMLTVNLLTLDTSRHTIMSFSPFGSMANFVFHYSCFFSVLFISQFFRVNPLVNQDSLNFKLGPMFYQFNRKNHRKSKHWRIKATMKAYKHGVSISAPTTTCNLQNLQTKGFFIRKFQLATTSNAK